MKLTGSIGYGLLLSAVVVMIYGCQAATLPAEEFVKSPQGKIGVSEHMIVDCLVPGEQRRLGKIVYLTPRKTRRIPARECAIRGGEYIIFDRSDYKTALRVWMAEAKNDNLEAITIVGEIYEKGLGTAPEYGKAASWYRKAAQKGYPRAQINLGHLYELGRGVPKDKAEAIRWYRLGAGLSERLAIQGFGTQQSANKEIQRLRKEIEQLQRELLETRKQLQDASSRGDETDRLGKTILDLEARIRDLSLKQTGETRARLPKLPSMDKGRYRALIIGNDRYDKSDHFPDLKTAVNDARQLKRILIRRYQFGENDIKLLENARYEQIFDAMASFNQQLEFDDKLLIYFAGHGIYDQLNQVGYWLPVDAKKDVKAFWISNEQITRQINEFRAHHVLVIADSCYSGTMTDLAILSPKPGMQDRDIRFIVKTLVEKRSRTVLTSGSLTPVVSSGGGKHSLFAEVLFQILETNEEIIAGKDLYNAVFPRVSSISELLNMKQEPVYGALKGAGHRAGDFLFVPQMSVAVADATHRQSPSEQF